MEYVWNDRANCSCAAQNHDYSVIILAIDTELELMAMEGNFNKKNYLDLFRCITLTLIRIIRSSDWWCNLLNDLFLSCGHHNNNSNSDTKIQVFIIFAILIYEIIKSIGSSFIIIENRKIISIFILRSGFIFGFNVTVKSNAIRIG